MQITILGCGAAVGVPVNALGWGKCFPENPKNHRLRSSVFIEIDGTHILIDSGPDFRQQVLTHHIQRIDAVLYTHAHADHINGINDLAYFSSLQKGLIPIYSDAKTLNALKKSFSYAFHLKKGGHPLHKPFLTPIIIQKAFYIHEIKIIPFVQDHGPITSLGFRIGDFAYSTDVVGLDDAAFSTLEGVNTWVVDCLRETPNPSHAHLPLTLSWIERVRPRKAYLTHMNFETDYEEILKKLPLHVEPAYDGLKLFLPNDVTKKQKDT